MSKKQTPPSGGLDRLMDFLASVKLSFGLLLAVAVTSILGTVIPQNEPPELYGKAFGEAWGHLILGLSINDMYHAYWFRTLMGFLALNLIVCSLKRLPTSLKMMKSDPAKDLEKMRQPSQEVRLAGDPGTHATQVEGLLKKLMGKVHRKEEDKEATVFFAEKGAWSRMGVYVVHLSVLVIFLGGMVGNFWGYTGHMIIDEGTTSNHVELDRGGHHDLDFSLRLDKFTVSFYDSGMPSEYRSDVTFLKDGQELFKAALRVNDPADHEGVDFYQSSYGSRLKSLKVRMQRGETVADVVLPYRAWVDLPGGGKAGVSDYRESVSMGGMYKGPLARVAYLPPGETQNATVVPAFGQGGMKIPQQGDVRFTILETDSVPYTGLSVKYDPGVWLIWVGCTLMVVGFIITFYFAHQKVWVRLSRSGGGTRVALAGSTNKNRAGMRRLLSQFAERLAPGGE